MRIEADAVIEAINIEAYIGQFVPLRASGKERVGKCPFHSDKSPSFTVTPETRLFYCFGCKAGGNVINFVERHEGVTFAEALAKLADMAGMTGGSRQAMRPALPSR